MDREYKREVIGTLDPCPYSGFAPSEVRVEGFTYTLSGHAVEGSETEVDCHGCGYCGDGCSGLHYPRRR